MFKKATSTKELFRLIILVLTLNHLKDVAGVQSVKAFLKLGITNETTTKAESPNLCKDRLENSTLPYLEDCQWYYLCGENGSNYLLSCPNNNFYDPYSGNCGPLVSPTACQDYVNTTTTMSNTINPKDKCLNQNGGKTFTYEENCQQYIYCNGKGGFMLINCPCNNYYYPDSGDCGPSDDPEICLKGSVTTEASTTDENETTLSPGEKCVDQGVGTTYPCEENCQQYIYCNGKGGFWLLNCPNNNYYDPYTGDCGPPELVSPTACKDSITTTTTVKTTLGPVDKCLDQKVGITFPYEENCQQYIYCNGKGGFYLLNCPNNNYYDPYTGDCGPPELVSPTACKDLLTTSTTMKTTLSPVEKCLNQEVGITFPYEENCQQYIYCNGKGGFLLINCPHNNYYYPDTGDCGPSDDPDICLKGSFTTEASTTIETETTLSPAEKCVDKDMGTTYPYEENCQQYIYCNGKGGFLLINCPNNNYYDPYTGDCGPPELVSPTACTDSITTSTSAKTTLSPVEKCLDQEVGITFPYEENCQQYIYCNGKGGYLLINCPYNNYYYPKTGDCGPSDDPEICLKQSFTTEASTTKETETTLSPSDKCVDQEVGITFPYEENCQKYIYCNGKGGFLLINCPYNNYYYPDSGDCGPSDDPEICLKGSFTTEASTTIETETTLSPSDKCVGQDVGTTYPYEENCQQYIYCNGKGGFLLINCPYNNYYYPKTGDCGPSDDPEICLKGYFTTEASTTTETETTLSPGEKCVDQGVGTTFPYEENCQQYIYCNGKGGFLLINCPNNNYYDPYTGDCGPPELVSATACKDLLTTSTTVKTTLSPVEKCLDQEVGKTFPYEENCQQYIYCNGKGGFLLINCPYNNYYYPDTGDCGPSDDPEICLKESFTTEASTTKETETTLSPSKKCVNQGVGITFPYEENCQQYIYCNGKGGYLLINCPYNNYYYPDTRDCGPSDDPEICLKESFTTEASTTKETETTLSPSDKCVNQDVGTTYPYEENCQQYIYCNGKGGFLLINCPYNNYYYPDTGDCGPSDDPEICLKTATTITSKPTTVTPKPTTVTTKPTTDTPKPSTITPKPTTITPKPSTITPKPTTITPKTSTITPKPTTVTPKPTTITPKPTTITPKPTTVTPKPTTITPKPTTVTPKPTTVTPKPTTVTPKPTTVTPKPTTITPKPTTVTPKPTTITPKPSTVTNKPTTTPALTTEASNSDICFNQPEFTTLPYPQDCSRYYFCTGNDLYYILSCPPNNYYDPHSGNCGPPELVSPSACRDSNI